MSSDVHKSRGVKPLPQLPLESKTKKTKFTNQALVVNEREITTNVEASLGIQNHITRPRKLSPKVKRVAPQRPIKKFRKSRPPVPPRSNGINGSLTKTTYMNVTGTKLLPKTPLKGEKRVSTSSGTRKKTISFTDIQKRIETLDLVDEEREKNNTASTRIPPRQGGEPINPCNYELSKMSAPTQPAKGIKRNPTPPTKPAPRVPPTPPRTRGPSPNPGPPKTPAPIPPGVMVSVDEDALAFASRFQFNENIPLPDPFQNITKVYQSHKVTSARNQTSQTQIPPAIPPAPRRSQIQPPQSQ